MARVKYYYDRQRLQFRQVKLSPAQWAWRVLGFLAASATIALIIISLAYRYLDSPREKQLQAELDLMKEQYESLNEQVVTMENIMNEMGERDENIYRVIFEAEPIASDIRTAGAERTDRYEKLRGLTASGLMIESSARVDRLAKQMYIQSKSFDEVAKLIQRKSDLIAAIPAIQPIRNRNLTQLASGFGYRIDPIYKTIKFHSGLDFNAPMRTPVFVTGNGRVAQCVRNDRGYGNYVLVDHGFGYQTLYAHLSGFATKPGQKVKRGETIGYVGNSGKSTGPHLHYEVLKSGEKINPINFFYSDLSPAQYEKILQRASALNQSFD